MTNYIPQYDENITKEKERDKNIETGEKWKLYASVNLPKLLIANDSVQLLHMIQKKIKYVNTDKIITQFHVGYMSIIF